MDKKLYLGTIECHKDVIQEVFTTEGLNDTILLQKNPLGMQRIEKQDLNKRVTMYGFAMFSESKEYLIEQMREYVSNEIEKANKRILDLQNSFQKVLDENEN